MNYPDGFRGTPYDCGRCSQCGHRDYTNDAGICGECEWREQRALKKIAMEKEENASHRAFLHMMMDVANVKMAKSLGWI